MKYAILLLRKMYRVLKIKLGERFLTEENVIVE
jgi:hypothetical protein